MTTTALGLIVTTAWLNRRVVAREMLVGWLDQRGIQASVRVDRLEFDGFVGHITVGKSGDPDFSGDVAVDYRLAAPWSSTGLGVTPGQIRLTRPVLKARWTNGRISLGSLDPLVEEFSGRPPRPDAGSPRIIVQDGALWLATDYGPLQAHADLTFDNGRLMRLRAWTPDLRLVRGQVGATGLSATLDLTTTDDRMAIGLDIRAADFAAPTLSGQRTHLGLTADLPYPDLGTRPDLAGRSGDGRASADLSLTGDALAFAGIATTGTSARIRFRGTTSGWIDSFRIVGDLNGDLGADRLSGTDVLARSAALVLTGSRLDLSRENAGTIDWSITGPASVRAARASAGDLAFKTLSAASPALVVGGRGATLEAAGPLALVAETVGFGDLVLSRVTGAADLEGAWNQDTRIALSGSMRSSGGRWPLLGSAAADDVPELGDMKAALGDFAVDVPAFRLNAGTPGTQLTLSAPARVTPRNGGVLTVLSGIGPVFAAAPGTLGGGALNLVATRGRGLPEATFAVPEWRLTPGGLSARLDGRAVLDFGLARGVSITTGGVLATDRGVLTYRAARCLDLSVKRLELGENDVLDVAGQVCAPDRPLIVVRDGSWRADLGLRDMAAGAPFLALDVDRIQGTAVVTGGPSGLGLTTAIASARVTDATTPRRFNAMVTSGSAALSDERWTGGFDLIPASSAPDQGPVAHLDLTHDGLTQRGGIAIDTGTLPFSPEGLQPADLTPLVNGIVGPPVTGTVVFKGQFAWDPALPEGISSGRLTIPGLDFTTPAGPVKGLKGVIDFTNLAPLTTAPGQSLRIDSLQTITPLTDLDLTFSLDKAAVQVAGGEIQVAGGAIRVEPFSVPLDRAEPFDGVIVFDRVQLGDLIKGAGFDDKVTLDAVASGRLPFSFDPASGVRISGGTLAAVQPGRLSIQREALSGLEADGGGAIPPGTVEDLAYQAMENLAFDTLSARVDSEDEGQVRVRFQIRGRHDPPERQELRLTWAELISRRFLNRPLPLPSDTGIDLNLNTSLNLNQVISDLLAINRSRNGTDSAAGTMPRP